jgi:hypothetical protein
MIVFCAADLIWATRIKSTADALSIPCRPARNLDMLNARLVDSPVHALIVDLDAGPHVFDLIRRVREYETASRPPSPAAAPVQLAAPKQISPIHILAFGPHVAVELFQEARAAGATSLMARGAFSSRLPTILQALNANPASIQDDLHD